jgi:hypothetical protein
MVVQFLQEILYTISIRCYKFRGVRQFFTPSCDVESVKYGSSAFIVLNVSQSNICFLNVVRHKICGIPSLKLLL